MMSSLRCCLRLLAAGQRLQGGTSHRHRRSLASFVEGRDDKKLLRAICAKIRMQGPMTVAQYMREVLTHPLEGYYVKRPALGAKGDFITSPEISQMFGECMAVWIIMEWQKMGAPKPLQLVELGPGRGTLMLDVLRTFLKLCPGDLPSISVHLVEINETLRKLQEATLCSSFHSKPEASDTDVFYHSGVSKFGPEVKWYRSLSDVPEGFSFFLAHEFFDALPVHQFLRHQNSWLEVLVDVDETQAEALRFVKSRHRTSSSVLVHPEERRDAVEVSPRTGVLVKEVSERIVRFGGSLLVVDYGHNGDKGGVVTYLEAITCFSLVSVFVFPSRGIPSRLPISNA